MYARGLVYPSYSIILFLLETFAVFCISNSHSHSHFIPLQPPNITCYFCYRLTIFLLFYLFTFLPLNAFLLLKANNSGQLLHFS